MLLSYTLDAQETKSILLEKLAYKDELERSLEDINKMISELKMQQIIEDLKHIGLPSNNFVEHSAMILEYSEDHEQAKWVAHMILPDIATGLVYRSNDFRADPKIKTGTAVQEDYFTTDTLEDGKVEYFGYGYDRGHLAPSADFRWNALALSESYYYSNMSPQLPEFNREKWAELENFLRVYAVSNSVPLYIITAPVFSNNSLKVKESKNGLSIPDAFIKCVYDPVHERSIAFHLTHGAHNAPLETFAISIEEAEKILQCEIFSTIDKSLKSRIIKPLWFEGLANGDAEPLSPLSLPSGHINTVQAQNRINKDAVVCGKVVASRYSRKGHLWLNIDKQFPNQLFSVFIRKENLVNFSYDLKNQFTNQNICVIGKVESFSDTPSITIEDEGDIKLLVR